MSMEINVCWQFFSFLDAFETVTIFFILQVHASADFTIVFYYNCRICLFQFLSCLVAISVFEMFILFEDKAVKKKILFQATCAKMLFLLSGWKSKCLEHTHFALITPLAMCQERSYSSKSCPTTMMMTTTTTGSQRRKK